MNASSASSWVRLPTPIKLVSAVNTYELLASEKFDATVLSVMRQRWKDTDDQVREFRTAVETVTDQLGGRNALMAFGHEYVLNRSENVARLDGMLEVVVKNARVLLANPDPSEAAEDLRDIAGALIRVLEPLEGELTFASSINVMAGLVSVLRQKAAVLRDHGFPAEFLERLQQRWAAVRADNAEVQHNLIAQRIATGAFQATLGRMIDFLVVFSTKCDALLADGVEAHPPGYAEARAWHETRRSEIEARRAESPSPAVPPELPPAVQAAVAAFRSETPVEEG